MDGDAGGSKTHEVYHAGLRNLHSLEMTAVELTERQVGRLENYPEMAARLRQHKVESEHQAQRLEQILQRHDAATSTVKNTVGSVMGNVAAALHMAPSDEVLKDMVANVAFEHQEIAAYTSLIAMAEAVGDTAAVGPLRISLSEEQSMADFLGSQIVPTTKRFLQLSEAGVKPGV